MPEGVNTTMDTVSKTARSRIMSHIRSKDTKPEIAVRKWLHHRGFRFRLHVKTLPGHPDIVLPKYKTAIFVNGCFWHQHQGCKIAHIPQTQTGMWALKFKKTLERDAMEAKKLTDGGWHTLVIWECQVKNGTYETILEEYFCNLQKKGEFQ